jgi:hypothetical protein
MARLRVQEAARERGVNLSELQMRVSTRMGRVVPLGTIRRYWYSTKKGLAQGEPIELVDVFLLGTIARALDVRIAELLNEDELGQVAAA